MLVLQVKVDDEGRVSGTMQGLATLNDAVRVAVEVMNVVLMICGSIGLEITAIQLADILGGELEDRTKRKGGIEGFILPIGQEEMNA